MKPNARALVIYVILTLIWGSAFILIKKGLDAFTPLQVAGIRVGSAFLGLLPFALFHVRKIPKGTLWPLIQTGLFGSLIPAFLFSSAQQEISSAVAGILGAFTPIWALLISRFVYKVAMGPLQVVGIIVGFIGSVLLVLQGSGAQINFTNWRGALVLLATLCYGINLNVIKHKLHDLKSIQIASLAVLFVGPIALGYVFWSGVPHLLVEEAHARLPFLLIVVLGITSTGIAVILFNRLLKDVSAVFASTITYATAIIAVLWGVLDGETLGLGHYLAMGLTIGGIILIRK